jgi:peptidoglycan biosynthesis protein MviN/MurJ (putative lipid II flippase)
MAYDIRKITICLFGIRILNALISFLVIPLSVKYFGISVDRDIWLLASGFISIVSLFFFGPINETFRAKFVFLREHHGETEALKKVRSLLIFLLLISFLLSLVVLFFPKQIKAIVAPSVEDGKATTAFITMLYLILPTMTVNQLLATGISVLNSYNVFYIPEVVGVISGIINLFCIIFFAPKIGIYSLIISMYISSLILFLIVIFFFLKKDIKILTLPIKFSWQDIKPFLYFALPFLGAYFTGQCNAIIERRLSNLLGTGFVSTIDYARRFPQLIQGVLSGVLTSVMVPLLTSVHSKNDNSLFFVHFKRSLQTVLVITCLSVSFLVGAADPICKFFFYRGEIAISTITDIIFLTKSYAITFIGISFYIFFSLILLSQQKGKVLAFLGTINQLIVIVLNVLLFNTFKMYTFAITNLFSHTVISMIMLKALKAVNHKYVFVEIIKYLALTCLLTITLLTFNVYLPDIKVLLRLFLNTLLLSILFFISMCCLTGGNFMHKIKE